MRILTLNGDTLNYAKAQLFKSKNGNLYYNIRLGMYTKPFKGASICLNKADFIPDESIPSIQLSDSNYRIKPIINNNTLMPKKDKLKNVIFSIEKTPNASIDQNELLLIVNTPYDKVEFDKITYTGTVEELLEAYNGTIWFNKIYKSPVKVYLIYGDCEIDIFYKNRNNEEEVIKFVRQNLEESVKKIKKGE